MNRKAVTFVRFVDQLGVKLSPAQRVLVRVAFDGVDPCDLDGEERTTAGLLFGPVDRVPPLARRVLAAVCGARSGKSYVLGALYALWRVLVADLSTLAPGELAVALIVAPDLRLARQVLRYALGAAQSSPSIAALIESDSEDSFTLRRPDGRTVSVECLPATRGGSALRGRSLVCAVLDECAFFRDASAVVNDADLYRAVAPRILPGGMIVLASTPWLEQGLLYTEFCKNFGAPTTALAVMAPTLVMLDTERNREVVAAERERDPDNAAREFGGQFQSGVAGSFFGPELLEPAIVPDLVPGTGADAIGGDIGLVQDASAFAAVRGGTSGRPVEVVDLLELVPSKGAPLKLSDVVARAAEFAKRHGQRAIYVDHHVLEPAREYAVKHGISLQAVEGGQGPKAERFLAVRKALREGRVRIPGVFAKITEQLALVAAKPQPGGGTSIILPRRAGSYHLDAVAALVIAISRALQGQSLAEWCGSPEGLAAIQKMRRAEDSARGWGVDPFDPGLDWVARQRANGSGQALIDQAVGRR